MKKKNLKVMAWILMFLMLASVAATIIAYVIS